MPTTLGTPTPEGIVKTKDVRSVLADLSPSSPQVRCVLHTPVFNFRDIESFTSRITYRCINSWDEAGLVFSYRQTEDTGWRRFSFTELVLLQTIADLKEFGFGSAKIKSIRLNIERDRPPGIERAPRLDRHILSVVSGNRVVLKISRSAYVGFQEEATLSQKSTFFCSWLPKKAQSQPYAVLPFYDYIERALQQPDICKKLWSLLPSCIEPAS